MSIRFGNDGTLYCNTVMYNYYTCRNLVIDGNAMNNDTTAWSTRRIRGNGYGADNCTQIYNNGGSNSLSTANGYEPTLVEGHKYYCSAFMKVISGSGTQGLYFNVADSNLTKISMIQLYPNSNSWTLYSGIGTASKPTTTSTGLHLKIQDAYESTSTKVSNISNIIVVDLTENFGAGNEPSKDWIDNNLLENSKFIFSLGSPFTGSNYSTYYSFGGGNVSSYYNLNSVWEPRGAFYLMEGTTSSPEVTASSGSSVSQYYVGGYERNYNNEVNILTYDYYCPIAEPRFGNGRFVNNTIYQKNGTCREWRKISAYNTSNAGGNYRFDFNNNYLNKNIRITPFGFSNLAYAISSYNDRYGASISANDINKYWCDRWIEFYDMPFIHIKNPNDKSIKFSASMKEAKKSFVSSYTASTLNDYVGLEDDHWLDITNTSELSIGDLAYIVVRRSDDNVLCRFVVQIKGISGTMIITDNVGYSPENEFYYNNTLGYDIICNDIEIRPEMNHIEFDYDTGTIKCKKLIMEGGL